MWIGGDRQKAMLSWVEERSTGLARRSAFVQAPWAGFQYAWELKLRLTSLVCLVPLIQKHLLYEPSLGVGGLPLLFQTAHCRRVEQACHINQQAQNTCSDLRLCLFD